MGKLARFEILLNNPEEAYFAGQEISGKVIIETPEPKKVNEILLELKGRARTYWTKHSGKSRKHYTQSEPYFLEQFNTAYTHKFTVTKEGKEKERILPIGVHEVPFSYTLPKSLPTSFEGEFGYVRYTCKATCERPWDFDIVCRKAFTVIGIEDINSDAKLHEPISSNGSRRSSTLCCIAGGSVSGELQLNKTGYTPGETILAKYKISNGTSRHKPVQLRLVQKTTYKAKTFAGHEHTKSVKRVVAKVDCGEVAPRGVCSKEGQELVIPSIPPRMGKCKIIAVNYFVELGVDPSLIIECPVVIGSIPLLAALLAHSKQSRTNGSPPNMANGKNGGVLKDSPTRTSDSSRSANADVQVTITDESGQLVNDEELSGEVDALLSARKRVRMPSSILSELYPTMPSPYYRESIHGPVNISDEKESAHYGEDLYAPKYPFYTD